ncbi:hypothetical protein GCM10009759_74940 [Kitasatospora saccharophila]|uniref:Uncharacterized protein n=1 Tax=Kitasatospora saccharophila TaxID=407973 RepID=A0ABP5JWP4_9ACTN
MLDDDGYDWCSKCQGYAVRRLTYTQLCYYRAAHWLRYIVRSSTRPWVGMTVATWRRSLSNWASSPIGHRSAKTTGTPAERTADGALFTSCRPKPKQPGTTRRDSFPPYCPAYAAALTEKSWTPRATFVS